MAAVKSSVRSDRLGDAVQRRELTAGCAETMASASASAGVSASSGNETSVFFNGVRDWGVREKIHDHVHVHVHVQVRRKRRGSRLDVCKATAQDVADHTVAVGQQAALGLAAGICAKLSSAGACQ